MKTTFETIHSPVPPFRVPVNSPGIAARRPGLFQNSSSSDSIRFISELRGALLPDSAVASSRVEETRGHLFSAVGPALKRFEFAEALRDVLAVLALFLLVSVTGIGIAASLFILFFVAV